MEENDVISGNGDALLDGLTVDDKGLRVFCRVRSQKLSRQNQKLGCSVDSLVNWSDHAAENKTGEVEKVYGMMAGLHADNGGADASHAAAEFAMWGISPMAWGMHAVPPSITGTYMPIPYKSDIEETQVMTSLQTQRRMHPVIQASRPRPKTISGDGVVFVDKLPDDEIVDPRVKILSLVNLKQHLFLLVVGIRQHLLLLVDLILLLVETDQQSILLDKTQNPTGRVGQAAHLAAAQSNPAGWSKRPAPVSAVLA
ncbi:hypothetical protein Tco_0002674 [Tanacetum coccineum]